MTAPVKRPQPAFDRAKIASSIAGLVQLAVAIGVIPPATGDAINTAAAAVIGAVFAVITVVGLFVHARSVAKVVTPTASPQNDAGQQLVPAGSAAATVDAASTLAAVQAIYPGVDSPGAALALARAGVTGTAAAGLAKRPRPDRHVEPLAEPATLPTPPNFALHFDVNPHVGREVAKRIAEQAARIGVRG